MIKKFQKHYKNSYRIDLYRIYVVDLPQMFKPRLSLTLTSRLTPPEWHHVADYAYSVIQYRSQTRSIVEFALEDFTMANYESAQATSRSLIHISKRNNVTTIREFDSKCVDRRPFPVFVFSFSIIRIIHADLFLSVLPLPWLRFFPERVITKCNFIVRFPLLIPITRIQFLGYVEILVREKLHRSNFNVKYSVKSYLVEISNIVR